MERKMKIYQPGNTILTAGVAFALTVALLSCGGKKELDGMVFRFNNMAEPQTLDPSVMTGHPEFTIAEQIFEGLTAYDPQTLEPMPGAAESWEVSRDGLTYTFTIRTDLVWSDGTQITADTFRDSWLRALAPETASQYAYQLWYIQNGEEYSNATAGRESVGIRVIDPFTLEVTLKSVTPFFLSLAAFQTYRPVPTHVIKEHGDDRWYLPGNIVSNGPFKVEEWKPQQYIHLVKNDSYHDSANVILDHIMIYPVEDDNTALEMFLNDELDWIQAIPSARLDEMRDHPDTRMAPFLATYYYKINTTANEALADKRVRQALSLAINRDDIITYITKAGQVPAWSIVPDSMPGYTRREEPRESLSKARALLAEAGYPDGEGFPGITILFNTMQGHKLIAETVSKAWNRELGIDVLLENQEWKVYLDRVTSMDYDIARAGWVADYPDPMTFLDLWVTDGGNNSTGWSNKTFDSRIEEAGSTADTTRRMSLLYNAESILVDEMPIIPIYHYVQVSMVKQRVNGLYDNFQDMHPLKGVSIKAD
jgi:oligopeptide transport system substrate-binding protein